MLILSKVSKIRRIFGQIISICHNPNNNQIFTHHSGCKFKQQNVMNIFLISAINFFPHLEKVIT